MCFTLRNRVTLIDTNYQITTIIAPIDRTLPFHRKLIPNRLGRANSFFFTRVEDIHRRMPYVLHRICLLIRMCQVNHPHPAKSEDFLPFKTKTISSGVFKVIHPLLPLLRHFILPSFFLFYLLSLV